MEEKSNVCAYCGAVLEEGADKCPRCGAAVRENQQTPVPAEAPAAVSTYRPETWKKVVGFCVGTVLIIVGFVMMSKGESGISRTSFGGDFYTYAYRGIVEISQQLEVIQTTLSWLLVAIGAAIDVKMLHD